MSRLVWLTPGLLLLCAAAFVALGPHQLGGPVTYVSVSGHSMEPTLGQGDFVLLRRADAYTVGEIVAYHPPDGGLIIHRIVGGNAFDGFVMQGDNRTQADPSRPTPQDIVGREWLRVPGIGRPLLTLGRSWALVYLAIVLAGAAGVGGNAVTRRYRRRRGRHASGVARRGAPRLPRLLTPSVPSLFAALALTAGTVGAVAIALALLALHTTPEHQGYVADATYDSVVRLDYTVSMDESTLYPSALYLPAGAAEQSAFDASQNPQPVDAFATQLAKQVDLMLGYQFETQAAQAGGDVATSLHGHISADLELAAGSDGWRQRTPLISSTPIDGTGARIAASFSLRDIASRIAAIEQETGYAPNTYAIRILPTVDVSGEVAGQPVHEHLTPTFTFDYNRYRVATRGRLVRSDPATAGHTVTTVNAVRLLGQELTIATARRVAPAVATVAMLLALLAGAAWGLGVGRGRDGGIAVRYRDKLLPVEHGAAAFPDARSVRVTTMRDLARVAERAGTLIHCEQTPFGTVYFVPDGDTVYEYTTRPYLPPTQSGIVHPR